MGRWAGCCDAADCEGRLFSFGGEDAVWEVGVVVRVVWVASTGAHTGAQVRGVIYGGNAGVRGVGEVEGWNAY